MTQEEKELLLLADLCGRLPYGVNVKTTGDDESYTLLSINSNKNIALIGFDFDGVYATSKIKIDDVKPYLRPISSMTEEEREQYLKFSYYGAAGYRNNDYKVMVATPSFEKMDFLNAHHFDYRGLIEKGLAIEAPEGMYGKEEIE